MFPRALPTALRPPYQIFLPKVQEMFDTNPKNMEKKFSKKIPFLSKRSSALIESSFDKRFELFLPKVRNG